MFLKASWRSVYNKPFCFRLRRRSWCNLAACKPTWLGPRDGSSYERQGCFLKRTRRNHIEGNHTGRPYRPCVHGCGPAHPQSVMSKLPQHSECLPQGCPSVSISCHSEDKPVDVSEADSSRSDTARLTYGSSLVCVRSCALRWAFWDET